MWPNLSLTDVPFKCNVTSWQWWWAMLMLGYLLSQSLSNNGHNEHHHLSRDLHDMWWWWSSPVTLWVTILTNQRPVFSSGRMICIDQWEASIQVTWSCHVRMILPCHTLRDITSQVRCHSVTGLGPAQEVLHANKIIHCTIETQQYWNHDLISSLEDQLFSWIK